MESNNQESHNDPQFVMVLESCLKMEMATAKNKFDANTAEINRMKIIIRTEIERRRQLKEKVAQMKRIKMILGETLAKLHISISETSDALEIMKANADDQYKLIQLRSQEYQDLIAKYKETWHVYHAMYEKFPLAKTRNAAKIDLEKAKIEYLVTTYKKTEIMTIVKQRRHINWIRTRCKIIEFVTVMVERLKLQKHLTGLKANVYYHRRELRSVEAELQVMHKKNEDQKRLRKQKMLEMAPPKINIPYREVYSRHQMRAKVQHQWRQIQENLDDTISVNTLVLEELCINDNVAVPSEGINVGIVSSNDCKLTAVQREKSNIESAVVTEKADTGIASIAPDAAASVEETASTDNDVQMKEARQETAVSQESVKTQVSPRMKENPLKYNAAKDTRDEVEVKRRRLERENSVGGINEINAPQPSAVVKELNLKSPLPSGPKIKRIEAVRYVVPKHPNIAASSMFSPHYDRCESNMSFEQDFMSKGPPSIYQDSLCNYRLSPISNISLECAEENAEMRSSSPKYTLQQDNKNPSDDRASPFQFTNFAKRKRGDFTTLF